jgi:hypothetical protein
VTVPCGSTTNGCAEVGTFGNIGRNAFRTPPFFQFDSQVSRIFPIHETSESGPSPRSLQRAEPSGFRQPNRNPLVIHLWPDLIDRLWECRQSLPGERKNRLLVSNSETTHSSGRQVLLAACSFAASPRCHSLLRTAYFVLLNRLRGRPPFIARKQPLGRQSKCVDHAIEGRQTAQRYGSPRQSAARSIRRCIESGNIGFCDQLAWNCGSPSPAKLSQRLFSRRQRHSLRACSASIARQRLRRTPLHPEIDNHGYRRSKDTHFAHETSVAIISLCLPGQVAVHEQHLLCKFHHAPQQRRVRRKAFQDPRNMRSPKMSAIPLVHGRDLRVRLPLLDNRQVPRRRGGSARLRWS